MIASRINLAGAGTQNSALAFGGAIPTNVTCTEAYNGSTWSAGGALSTARYGLAGAGTQNAALGFVGGTTPTIVACTEAYNGTTWSTGGAMITARVYLGGAGASSNAVLGFGGQTPTSVACTEAYNGTSWVVGSRMNVARNQLSGTGTQTAALAFAGQTVTCTEIYTTGLMCTGISTATQTQNISEKLVAVGPFTQYRGITYSGSVRINCLDGSPDITYNEGDGFNNIVCTVLTQTGIQAYTSSLWCTPLVWQTRSRINTARFTLGGVGTQNAALGFGGLNPTFLTCTEA
jgi:hypothetical protein